MKVITAIRPKLSVAIATALSVAAFFPSTAMAQEYHTGHVAPPMPEAVPMIEIPGDINGFNSNTFKDLSIMSGKITQTEETINAHHEDTENAGEHETWIDENAIKNPVYTNIDSVLTEDMAPDALRSLHIGEELYNCTITGKAFQINSDTEKKLTYRISEADGMLKVAPGGEVTYLPDQDTDPETITVTIHKEGAYAPVKAK